MKIKDLSEYISALFSIDLVKKTCRWKEMLFTICYSTLISLFLWTEEFTKLKERTNAYETKN